MFIIYYVCRGESREIPVDISVVGHVDLKHPWPHYIGSEQDQSVDLLRFLSQQNISIKTLQKDGCNEGKWDGLVCCLVRS